VFRTYLLSVILWLSLTHCLLNYSELVLTAIIPGQQYHYCRPCYPWSVQWCSQGRGLDLRGQGLDFETKTGPSRPRPGALRPRPGPSRPRLDLRGQGLDFETRPRPGPSRPRPGPLRPRPGLSSPRPHFRVQGLTFETKAFKPTAIVEIKTRSTGTSDSLTG